jgi:hypothetical protein
MSHKPPLPDAAQPPFPAHPAPTPIADDEKAASEDSSPSDAGISARTLGIAAGAAAIGSAAIAAALIFYNRSPTVPASKKKKDASPRTPRQSTGSAGRVRKR